LITVRLYGHLAKKFGRSHRLDVRTPREAVRALVVNFPEFRPHVLKHNEPGYHVRVGKEYRDEAGLDYPADAEIKIVPAVGGASSTFRIILGAALVVFAPYAAGWIFANTSMVGLATAIATYAPTIGMSLILGGVSQLLFQPPKAQSVERPESKPSYSFDGPVNTMSQGNPVPICYGELIVGSQVVSAGFETGDIAV
jgi:predicted phage tail protein